MIPQCKNKKMTTIFEGKLFSKQSKELDMKNYKYLLITYALYDYESKNTAGCSNTVILDLTKKGEKVDVYQCTKAHAYSIFADNATLGSNMYVGFEVNAEKTNFKAVIGYSGKVQESTVLQYYVSKIVGVK